MFYEVIPIRQFREGAGVLTYSSGAALFVGQIVEIPLGRSKTYGVVKKRALKVDFETKPVSRVMYDTPLPEYLVKAMLWLTDYYNTPLPGVAKMFLPNGFWKKRRGGAGKPEGQSATGVEAKSATGAEAKNVAKSPKPTETPKIPLNTAQKQALRGILSVPTPTRLLFGVTGSGKTNIYLKLAEDALKAQKSTILLVPEIALTSQLVQVFEQTFEKNVLLIHSRQTEAERHAIWEQILEAREPLVIIGPRSALLSPVHNLGLIIIDEAHETTYFQENTPKYSALRLASVMAKEAKVPCIYGTATPLVSDYHLAKSRGALVTLSKKAKETAKPPKVQVIDLKNRDFFSKNRYFSNALLEAISRNLEKGQQTLIFHNRRGSSPLTICENCGWQAMCPNCYLPLTLHSDTYTLTCHTCNYQTKVPTCCPDCKGTSLVHKGFGTKLLESELKKLFKNARISRFDADNSKAEALDQHYLDVRNGEVDIIVGTQTVAKGLDLPKLATVGIVQADAGLMLPDFAAEEKTFHLISQVVGRVGRGHLDTSEVIVQTYQPDSPVIEAGISADYQKFYEHTLALRKKGHFPPFYYLAKLTVTYKTEATTTKYARQYHQLLKKVPDLLVSLSMPAFHEHTSAGYSWQIIVRATSRAKLLSTLKSLPYNAHLHLTLDPPTLL